MKSYLSIIPLAFLAVTTLHAQEEHGLGALEDDEAYASVPLNAERLTRDYVYLPSSYSLRKYCPTPGDQGIYGTCVGWATAFAARTITENVNNGWTDESKKDQETFSPIFVYARIKPENDKNCREGTYIHKALELMKTVGVPKYNQFDVDCASYVPPSLLNSAKKYKIDDYYRLFDPDEFTWRKVNATKKAISQDRPVIISMRCYKSFNDFSTRWNGLMDIYQGNHALCVVAYDDSKYGGAFQVMNSWGTLWGDDGFGWITYNDFKKQARYGFEMYVKKMDNPVPQPQKNPEPTPAPIVKPTPVPTPMPQPIKENILAGSLQLQLSTGEELKGALVSNGILPYYKIAQTCYSGNRFRIHISNDAPAYVYVLSSDLQNNTTLLFPQKGVSPALFYKSNNIALPSETTHITFGKITGKDYLCVLYSIKELPIHDMMSKMNSQQGTFYEKVKSALGDLLVPFEDVTYKPGQIDFNAKTDKIVLPIISEITHN